METLFCWGRRLALVGACGLAIFGIVEGIARVLGISFLNYWYHGGRLLEFGAILMVIAIGLLLREILAELRKGRA